MALVYTLYVDIDLGILKLDANQAKLYRTLLVSGQLSRAEMSSVHGFTPGEVNTIVSLLVEKKLARAIPGMADRYAPLMPLGSTKEELEVAASELAVLGREIGETSTTEMANLKTALQQASDEFKSSSQRELDNLNQQITTLEGSVAAVRGAGTEKVGSAIQSQREATEGMISSSHQSQQSRVGQLKTDTSTKIASKTDMVNQSSASAKEKHTAINEQASQGLQPVDLTPVQLIQQETATSLTGVFSDINTKLEELNRSSVEIVGTAKDLGAQAAQSLDTAATNAVTEMSSQLRNSGSTMDEAIRMRVQQFDTMEQNWGSNLNTQKGVLSESMAQIDSQFQGTQNTLSSAHESMTQITNDLDTRMGQDLDLLAGKSAEFMQEASDQLGTHVDTNHADISSLLANEITSIRTNLQSQLDQFMAETNRQLQSMASNFGSELENRKDLIDQQRTALKDAKLAAVNEQVDITKVNVKNSIDTSTNAYKSKVDEYNTSLQESQSGFNDRLEQAITDLDRMSMETQTLVQGSKTRLDDWNIQIQGTIKQQTDNLEGPMLTDLKQKIGDMTVSIDSQVTSLQASAQESLNSIRGRLNELSSTSIEQINNNLQLVQQTLTEVSDTMRSRFDAVLQQATSGYHGLIDEQSGATKELISQLSGDVTAMEQDMLASLQSAYTGLQTNMNETLGNLDSQLQSTISGIFDSISQEVQGTKAVGNSILQSIETLSSSGTEKQLGVVKQTFENYGAKYSQSTGTVSQKIGTLTKLLDAFFKIQEDTATPALTTTHVVGKQSIIQYIQDMVTRVKRGLTILVPEISMIDVDQITALKSSSQITIISKIDPVSNSDWIEKMKNAPANVLLRNLKSDADFIGAEREGEEIIVGTLDEGTQDYVAIASTSEHFIKLFGSEIISAYSRSRSDSISI